MQRLDTIKKKKVIDHAVEIGMAGRKQSSEWQKKLVTIVAMVIIGVPAFGFTFPALAQHIPIIGGLFEREDIHGRERLSAMQDYAIVIGETKYLEGGSVTLSEAYFDGDRIYLSFLIESETAVEHAVSLPISPFRLFVNDEKVRLASGVGVNSYLIDAYTHLSIVTLDPVEAIDLEAKIEVEFNGGLSHGPISLSVWNGEDGRRENIPVVHGPLSFRAPIALAEHEREMIEVAQSLGTTDFEITVHEVSISPVTMRVDFTHTHLPFTGSEIVKEIELGDEFETKQTWLMWEIVDDLGNSLVWDELGRDGNSMIFNHDVKGWLLFAPPSPEATQIILTPILVTTTTANVVTEVDEEGWGWRSEGNVVEEERMPLSSITIDLP